MSQSNAGLNLPALALHRTMAGSDTDTATRQTVVKMCELIRDSARDRLLQKIAADIKRTLAGNSSDSGALAWGVFWWVKHHVKFRSDEATLALHLGERDQQDLLISPAVLVRMDKPSEDCDGFSMLTAALLAILNVPVVIATVAVDPSDTSRWSHVFVCAIVNGRVMPLDTSHGTAPGWMVPKSRISRWQTWTLDGRPADVPIPTYHGLHGYRTGLGWRSWEPMVPLLPRRSGYIPEPMIPLLRRRMNGQRGMGQTYSASGLCSTSVCIATDPESGLCQWDDSSCSNLQSNLPITSPLDTNPLLNALPNINVPLNTPVTPKQAGLTPAQEAQLIAATGNSAVSLIRTATGGPYTVAGTNLVYNPATGALTTAAGANQIAALMAEAQTGVAQLGPYLPMIGIAVVAILVLPALLGRK